MLPGYKLFIISLLPCCCLAQADAQWEAKALYKELLYLDHPLYGSRNPVAISEAPADITVFDAAYSSASGNYKLIHEGRRQEGRTGSIYGIKKLGKLSFEGSIEYNNETLAGKQWANYLYVSENNPFIISDSIPSDYGVEKFKLNGGFSYEIAPQWSAAMRATYDAGTLADQTDPRPSTKGMRFILNPGVIFRPSETFAAGISAEIGRLNEATSYTVVNSIEPNVNTLFIFKGLGSPEVKSALGYKRTYEGGEYRGDVQIVWNSSPSLSNFLEAGYGEASEYASDGDTGFDYKGGDYKATTWSLAYQLRLKAPSTVHRIAAMVESKAVDGIWYIQTQSSDTDGNIVWTVRDKSITHKESSKLASLSYTIDFMKGGLPSLTASLRGTYTSSDIKQYPDLYGREYALATYRGDVSKHLHILKGLLSLSLNGVYASSLSQGMEVDGSKLKASYLEPAFLAACSSYYAFGIGAGYQTPLSVHSHQVLIGLRASAGLKRYNGQGDLYADARRMFGIGLYLTF
ncbi:MAG: hypothetical protein LBJ58_08570 [Tannerellaceae bacterium]|jgi:hypothetical protein|nr:hypothetical protein [Tannerellaceae bacterium]